MLPKAKNADFNKRRQAIAGFSLIELLIVVAIILIIAAIAIPNYMRSKILANEAATVQNVRNITTAEVIYSTTYGIGYSALLVNLGGTGTPTPTNAILLDDVLAQGTKSGFTVTYASSNPDVNGRPTAFTVNAAPVDVGHTGNRYFFTDQTGVIRQSVSGPATVTDTPI
ncbi:MAG TPA: prepilin-type N-terminal cleavage/methylation domain-containing protein [Candidatus Dormibacteraeota bacterium]|nr:prepilin-type N-terminal cleavage/methylation domain-containing protein [Candidatus Dormibacteraeota bacterium]